MKEKERIQFDNNLTRTQAIRTPTLLNDSKNDQDKKIVDSKRIGKKKKTIEKYLDDFHLYVS